MSFLDKFNFTEILPSGSAASAEVVHTAHAEVGQPVYEVRTQAHTAENNLWYSLTEQGLQQGVQILQPTVSVTPVEAKLEPEIVQTQTEAPIEIVPDADQDLATAARATIQQIYGGDSPEFMIPDNYSKAA